MAHGLHATRSSSTRSLDVPIVFSRASMVGSAALLAWVWSRFAAYVPSLTAGLDATLVVTGLLSSVLLHEYGHAMAARAAGIACTRVHVTPIGGWTELGPVRSGVEAFVAAAGPAANAALFLVLRLVPVSWLPARSGAGVVIDVLVAVNAALVVVNLLPLLPLDGGRIVRGLLVRAGCDERLATATLVGAGVVFGVLAVIAGVFDLHAGPYRADLVLVGLFVAAGACAHGVPASSTPTG